MNAHTLANRWAYRLYRREFTAMMALARTLAKERKEGERVGSNNRIPEFTR